MHPSTCPVDTRGSSSCASGCGGMVRSRLGCGHRGSAVSCTNRSNLVAVGLASAVVCKAA